MQGAAWQLSAAALSLLICCFCYRCCWLMPYRQPGQLPQGRQATEVIWLNTHQTQSLQLRHPLQHLQSFASQAPAGEQQQPHSLQSRVCCMTQQPSAIEGTSPCPRWQASFQRGMHLAYLEQNKDQGPRPCTTHARSSVARAQDARCNRCKTGTVTGHLHPFLKHPDSTVHKPLYTSSRLSR